MPTAALNRQDWLELSLDQQLQSIQNAPPMAGPWETPLPSTHQRKDLLTGRTVGVVNYVEGVWAFAFGEGLFSIPMSDFDLAKQLVDAHLREKGYRLK